MITLLITRTTLDTDWRQELDLRLGTGWRAQLFFVHEGIHRVGDPLWTTLLTPGALASYCAHGHMLAQGPPPTAGILPGGVATLGRMLTEATHTLSLPSLHWPSRSGAANSRKRIALFADHPDHAGIEALRLAVGLAGCDHRMTLIQPTPWPVIPDAANTYLELFPLLDITVAPTLQPDAFDIILRL
ncbi:MAG: hypothetical protein HQL95_10285 [Magnetococcales bacterium]|nr:hypothetical protein [Magnetococcales bacterium]